MIMFLSTVILEVYDVYLYVECSFRGETDSSSKLYFSSLFVSLSW